MILECINCGYETSTIMSEYRCSVCTDVLYPKHLIKFINLNVMGEGNTPMFKNQFLTKMIGCKTLQIKNEGVNPTGSFKDRGSAFELNVAKQNLYTKIVLASTGNMGASMAAYSAFYGFECTVFVPEDTAENKLNQIKMYGANIKKINGNYIDCMFTAEKYAEINSNVYLAGDYFWRMLGMTSLGKEILFNESNIFADYIFVPIGNGNLLYSIYMVIRDSLPDKRYWPTIIGVQIEHYDSLVSAFNSNSIVIPTKDNYKTLATAVNITDPLQQLGVLKAIKETKGSVISVTDEEMLNSQKILSEKGLFLEPSGAISFAGVIKLKNLIKDKNVVAVGTGHGLKGV